MDSSGEVALRQQLQIQKQLYSQRLEEIVLTIKQAAQQTMGQYDQVYMDTLRSTLTADRENKIQTLIEQVSQQQSQLLLQQNRINELQKTLDHRNERYRKIKGQYSEAINKIQTIQLENRPEAGTTELKFRIQLLEQQLSAKTQELDIIRHQMKEPQITKQEHETIIQSLQAKNQIEVNNIKNILEQQNIQTAQKLEFSHEKYVNRLRIGFDKKIHQLNYQINQLQLQIKTRDNVAQANDDLKEDYKLKVEQIDQLNKEILKQKQQLNEQALYSKQLKQQNEQLVKSLKQVRRELQEIGRQVAQARVIRPLVFNTDSIEVCLANMQKNMITQQSMRQIANCFYEVIRKKQEVFKSEVGNILNSLEEDM